jgi:glucose/arabinose dehydrogenase
MHVTPQKLRGMAHFSIVTILILTALGTSLSSHQMPVSAQSESPLIVPNSATENPDLVDVDLGDPNGFGIPAHQVQLPAGYRIDVVATGLGAPRFMAFDGADNLIVTALDAGIVYRFPFADGQLGDPETLISGLQAPSSAAFFTADGHDYLYVGEVNQISRFPYSPDGPVGAQEVVIPNLPTEGHFTRTVVFGPDGMLYLSVGSSCNICQEDNPIRAAISIANPDGSDLTLFAKGLRNAVGLAFQPETKLLWATVNERDNQGNEIPPDLVTIVDQGASYGWPDCLPPDATPQVNGANCSDITPPTVGIQAHSAPLGLAFLSGDGVPSDVSGDLLVAQHGSWNRQPPAPPKLLLIDFEDGNPVSAHDFATGWQDESGDRWGRPVGIVVAPDGSLIVSDDEAGYLYRISAA